MTRKPEEADRERRLAEFCVGHNSLRFHRLSNAVNDAKRYPPQHED